MGLFKWLSKLIVVPDKTADGSLGVNELSRPFLFFRDFAMTCLLASAPVIYFFLRRHLVWAHGLKTVSIFTKGNAELS